MHELIEALRYDATHADLAGIMAEAKARFERGESVRGLPKPHGAPEDAWYSVQHRRNGATYLYLRWRYPAEAGGKRARSLGRLN